MELGGGYRAHQQQNQHVVLLHYIPVLAEDCACGGKAKLRVICVSVAARLESHNARSVHVMEVPNRNTPRGSI